ncbi:MAG: hypothetical protein C0402_05160 [Thermodesulfovibrio sp.]|nr:hypothetical protein [Thermodesulfovibrio sp.]
MGAPTNTNQRIMSDGEFTLLQGLVSTEFGIVLKDAKRAVLQTRVSQRLGVLKHKSYQEYFEYVMADPSKEELYLLASHITNNETYFFREKQQFDIFKLLLEDIKTEKQKAGKNTLSFLSLASSSGEEAYTMNMVIQESGLFVWDWDIRIIGVDIDRDAIERARKAVYRSNSFRTAEGDFHIMKKYFVRDDDRYMLKKHLTKNIEFRHGNLIRKETFEGLSGIDAIFCRNVMIYMRDETIRLIAEHLYSVLSDTGYLFVGASESLIQKTDLFYPEHVQGTIVYRKNLKAKIRE